jgi:outer membrane protein OmpA-like peptidoglycan-associated protein
MEHYNNISDKDLNRLLKQRLLEQEDNALLEAEAKLVFSSTVVLAPDVKKEEAFLKKLKKTKAKFWKWLLKGLGIFTGLATSFYVYQHSDKQQVIGQTAAVRQLLASGTGKMNGSQKEKQVEAENSDQLYNCSEEQQLQATTSAQQMNTKEKHDTISPNFKLPYLGIYTGQLIDFALKENGDCSSPIVIRDSIIVLANSSIGPGRELEISGNAADDELYFETEHNTVWYKFFVRKNCKLAFDITPMSEYSNFDFMLFQDNVKDFPTQVKEKKVMPVRTCISRNNAASSGKTGLSYDELAPAYIHSDKGPAYVKYVEAKKGQVFYLVVDGENIKNSGDTGSGRSGYTIRFHYKNANFNTNPNELYVGKSILANKIYFIPGKPEFLPDSAYETAIDSIAGFLKSHPKIKVEIQGHVNTPESKTFNGKKTPSQELSEKRAWAVRLQLISKGIDPQRMLAVGYAGTRRKIQNPKTIRESSKNVRVDIVILSLDYEADLKSTELLKYQAENR